MLSLNQIWNNILIETESKVSTLGYDLYINTLKPVGIYKDRIILLAENATLKGIVEKKYKEFIKKSTSSVFPSLVDVEIITEEDVPNLCNVEKEVDIPVSNNFVKETEDVNQFRSEYTFDSFVVGKSNEYAYAVASAVAETPGTKYNPLFVWGGVGLGKTHLLHAIGNYINRNQPEKKTLYVTSENFTNEMIEALRDNDVNAKKDFRAKYRNVDVLMIDDIQFLANKEGTQEEFFHTFNELYLADKQIIICSDRPPKEINIAERLKTRFSTGIIADIQPPNLETRIAILQKKCIAKKQHVDMKILTLIAEKITSNIRDMEGILTRIISYASLVGGDCNDMNIVNDALKDYADSSNEIVTIDNIVDATCDYFKLDKAALVGKKKNKEIVIPRQICIYLITDILSIPLISIGQYFGGRDHTTVMHARDKISEEIKTNGVIAAQVKDIRDRIYNR
ncbi:MAG: chromosomal replication initiator protein DnaA [Corallococcus sp.]|nr:chromosomal replication initiator protein DnaA [Corallococcus sp.]